MVTVGERCRVKKSLGFFRIGEVVACLKAGKGKRHEERKGLCCLFVLSMCIGVLVTCKGK